MVLRSMHMLFIARFMLSLSQLTLGITLIANAHGYENFSEGQASANIHEYENFSDEEPYFQKFNDDLKGMATSFDNKVLLNPEVKELTGFISQGGIHQANSGTLLTIKGILLILQASGKIKQNITIDKTVFKVLELGTVIDSNFGRITRLQTGYYSDQIYEVTLKPEIAANPEACSFVIKSVKWGGDKGKPRIVKTRHQPTPVKEIQDLKRVEQIILPRALALKQIHSFFPTLAVAQDTFYYFDSLGEKQYVAVLPMALGNTVANIFNNAILLKNEKKIDQVMEQIGRALGEFHYHMATLEEQQKVKKSFYADFQTIVHGDFHRGNIFVGPQGITFIDNASMADSIIHPQSIMVDIYRLFQTTNYSYSSLSLPLTQLKRLKSSFIWFSKGYAQAFPSKIQEKIEQFLMDTFTDINLVIQSHFKNYLTDAGLSSPPKINRDDKYWPILRLTEQSIKLYLSQPGSTKEDLASKIFQSTGLEFSHASSTNDSFASDSMTVGDYVE